MVILYLLRLLSFKKGHAVLLLESIVFLELSLKLSINLDEKNFRVHERRRPNLEYIQFPCTFPSALRSHISLDTGRPLPATRTLETLHSSILSRFYFFPLLPNNVLRNNAYILAYRKATENRSYPKLKYLMLTRQEGRKIMESIYEQINKTRNDVFFPYFFRLDKTSLKQRFHLAFHSQRSQPN